MAISLNCVKIVRCTPRGKITSGKSNRAFAWVKRALTYRAEALNKKRPGSQENYTIYAGKEVHSYVAHRIFSEKSRRFGERAASQARHIIRADSLAAGGARLIRTESKSPLRRCRGAEEGRTSEAERERDGAKKESVQRSRRGQRVYNKRASRK